MRESEIINIDNLTNEELEKQLEQAYQEYKEGNYKSALIFFAEFKEKYNL